LDIEAESVTNIGFGAVLSNFVEFGYGDNKVTGTDISGQKS